MNYIFFKNIVAIQMRTKAIIKWFHVDNRLWEKLVSHIEVNKLVENQYSTRKQWQRVVSHPQNLRMCESEGLSQRRISTCGLSALILSKSSAISALLYCKSYKRSGSSIQALSRWMKWKRSWGMRRALTLRKKWTMKRLRKPFGGKEANSTLNERPARR